MTEPTHEQAVDAANILIDWVIEHKGLFGQIPSGRILETLNSLRTCAADEQDAEEST